MNLTTVLKFNLFRPFLKDSFNGHDTSSVLLVIIGGFNANGAAALGPLKYIKKCPPTQDIVLFLRSSTRTVASLK